MPSALPSKERICVPLAVSHNLKSPLALADRANLPSREKATALTSLALPLKDLSSLPLATSDSLTVPLWPDNTRFASGEIATDSARAAPENRLISPPAATSHNLIVLSQPPESAYLPSADRATEVTMIECPVNDLMLFAAPTSNSSRTPSPPPARRYLPSAEKTTEKYPLALPASVVISLPLETSQSLTPASCPTDARYLPSGENATART